MPKVSIIVPVYNAESYLTECLNSLTAQTLRDIEIICIDDGSVDDSPRLLDEAAAADSRIRVIHQANAGVSHTRNVGLGLATGEFIMFVDSDDFISIHACENTYNLACKNKADIVVFGGKTFPTLLWADNAFANQDKVVKGQSCNAVFYEQGSTPLMCNKLYRRSIIENYHIRFQEQLTIGEDNAFQFTVFPRAKTIVYTSEVLYFYRIHAGSLVRDKEDDCDARLWKHFEIVTYVYKLWEAMGIAADWRRNLIIWAIDFLYRDSRKSNFNTLCELAPKMRALIDELLDGTTFGSLRLDGRTIDHLPLICEADHIAEANPYLTVIIDSLDGTAAHREAIKSLLCQSMQSMQLLVVEDASDYHSEFMDYFKAAAEQDCRISFVPSRKVEDVLPVIKGQYVMYTYDSMLYEESALQRMMEYAGISILPSSAGYMAERSIEAGSDIITMADSVGALHLKDAYSAYVPHDTDPLQLKTHFSAADFRGAMLSVTSMATCNKVISKALIDQTWGMLTGAPNAQSFTMRSLLWHSVAQGQHLTQTMIPCVTMMALHSNSHNCALITALFNECHEYCLHHEEALPAFTVFSNALMLYCPNDEASLLLAQQVQAMLEPHANALQTNTLLSADEQDALAVLLTSTAEYLNYKKFAFAELLISTNRFNLLQVGDFAQELAFVTNSISFKVGRMATAVPRLARSRVKQLLGR